MKTYALLVIAGFILALASCLKNGSEIINGNSNIIGKWNVTKLSVKDKNLTGGTEVDTTYADTALNSLDFLQFKSNGTAVLSESGIFSISGKTPVTASNGSPTANTFTFNYSIARSTVTLSNIYLPTYLHAITDHEGPLTLQLDANNMVMEEVKTDNDTYRIITDTYYTKGN